MQGNLQVIEKLNELLAGELSAMDQYFIHSRMYDDWGLKKLYERIDHEFEDEKEHASKIIERILFLGGKPDMVTRVPLNVGSDVPSMLQSDLDLEYKVIIDLREIMALCEQVKDYQTREMLQVLLDDTENDHTHWLEQQLGLIAKIGLPNYLQSQMG
ncbi:MAG: bacterioferritin [Thalassolituus sp.]|jgi:bacterioferritin|uniref:Bacterioferritin n=2 Tax=root TaxID=1 RepID=M5E188_9GAMM|nr:bacterioferritin [Thalassolituus oleivorans]PCI48743.1 MAG: bacterioferritin [Oceanospirillales bacterium]PHQ87458.1 MAG: bacterioferritin [Thalassobium sp.]AHK16394.1 bacterioferritin [Thalassolituus oleivorans R6-15]APR67807.1 bacterioferritin [Thalassolituus oleivorans]MBQ0726162.1 bacterioferritin [Thalassolituus oleivorans]